MVAHAGEAGRDRTHAPTARLVERRFAWFMVSPSLLLMAALGFFPLAFLVGLSFVHLDLASPQSTGWTGVDNYARLLRDSQFWHAIGVTIVFTAGSVVLQVGIGLGLALLLFRAFPGEPLVRTLLILPIMLAPALVGMLWRTLLLTPRFGIVDYVVYSLGFGSHGWLTDAHLALACVTVINVWQWTPFAFLIFLANLHALPAEPLEAAKIDCRSSWQEFVYVMLPLLRPAIVIVVILRVIATLNAFPQIYTATEGGPGIATQILNLYIYNTTFVGLSVGYGSALGTVQLLLTVVVAAIFFRVRTAR